MSGKTGDLITLLTFILSFHCILSYERAVNIAPHGFVESKKFDFNYQDTDAHVTVNFVNHESTDFLWIWSLYTCNATVDIYQIIGIFTESEVTPGAFTRSVEFRLLKSNVPVFMTRQSQNLRVTALLPQDCGDRDCDFHFRFRTNPPCQIDAHFHRGVQLEFNHIANVPENVYKWNNGTAVNQLFSIQAYTEDFPLTLTVTVSTNSWIELHHSWNLGGTIFRGLHRGSFSVSIPIRSEYESGSVMCFWIRTHDQSPYTVKVENNEDSLLLTFYSNGFKVLLFILCALIVIFMCYGRCRFREEVEQPPGPVLFTKDELTKITDVFYFSEKTKSDTRCSICLEDYETGVEMRKLPCGHDFHRECIDTWLTNWQRKCPLCQQDIGYAEDFFQKLIPEDDQPRDSEDSIRSICYEMQIPVMSSRDDIGGAVMIMDDFSMFGDGKTALANSSSDEAETFNQTPATTKSRLRRHSHSPPESRYAAEVNFLLEDEELDEIDSAILSMISGESSGNKRMYYFPEKQPIVKKCEHVK